jgi:hypothetical protein
MLSSICQEIAVTRYCATAQPSGDFGEQVRRFWSSEESKPNHDEVNGDHRRPATELQDANEVTRSLAPADGPYSLSRAGSDVKENRVGASIDTAAPPAAQVDGAAPRAPVNAATPPALS